MAAQLDTAPSIEQLIARSQAQRGSGQARRPRYHLLALPSGRLRVLSAWVNAASSGPQIIELGLIDERYAAISAEASPLNELERMAPGEPVIPTGLT